MGKPLLYDVLTSMYLARVQAYDDDRSPSQYGKAHAAWWDGGERYWLACSTSIQEETLFAEVDEPESPHWSEVTCKKCLKLKLSHFRRVKRHIEGWLTR